MTAEIKAKVDEAFESIVGRPPTDQEDELELLIVETELRDARAGNSVAAFFLEKVGLEELI